MRYIPPEPGAPGGPSLADLSPSKIRDILRAHHRRIGDALWAADDAEAQVRWAIADGIDPEIIQRVHRANMTAAHKAALALIIELRIPATLPRPDTARAAGLERETIGGILRRKPVGGPGEVSYL